MKLRSFLALSRTPHALLGAVALSVILARRVTPTGTVLYTGVALIAGALLLLMPAVRLLVGSKRSAAVVLLNRASFYPLSLLGMMAVKAALRI